jgi:feruloyl esterase
MRMRKLGAAALIVVGWTAAAQASPESDCAALNGKSLAGAPMAAHHVAAQDAAAQGFCEVSATLSPVAGSHIGVVYRLPDQWNGKLLGLGGGGWAGNVRLAAASAGLARGYATAQTDGGHPGTDVWNTDWTKDPQAVTDFAWRAIHEMTVAGKALVQLRYGKAQTRAFYQGCSTGGRQGLMEAQRFPDDYDGIIAGAPVYTLQVQSSAILRNRLFAGGNGFTKATLTLVNTAVLAACDKQDGLADGILADPRRCRWDPAAIACKPGAAASANCLTAGQVATLRRAYDGQRAPDGSWAALPLQRGGEMGWARFIDAAGTGVDATRGGGMMGLGPLLFGDRPIDMAALSLADVPVARASAFAKTYEAKDPDLRRFMAHGGRLILWHGWSDPGPSPINTIAYYDQVRGVDRAGADRNVRLFLNPGVEHCGGGPGADLPDTLTALETWVEQGTPPATVLATRADKTLSRPLCPYPSRPLYDSKGEPALAASFRCDE